MCNLYHSPEFKGHVNGSNVSVMLWCKLLIKIYKGQP